MERNRSWHGTIAGWPENERKPRLRRVVLALPALALGCAGVQSDQWAGACPDEGNDPAGQVVAISLSDSERAPEMIERRLALVQESIRQAADCEAPFTAILIDDRKVAEIVDVRFASALGTEIARDREVPSLADPVFDEVEAALADQLTENPPSASDPGLIFQYLADLEARQGDGLTVRALILSDGITDTPDLTLNRPLDPEEVDDLAAMVAPEVRLHGVEIDWPGLGATRDPRGAPQDWLDTLKQIWERVCQRATVDACVITTTI